MKGFKKNNTGRTMYFVNDAYVIYQRTGQNMYDVLSSSFFNGIEWDMAHRFKGTLKQVKEYVAWTIN